MTRISISLLAITLLMISCNNDDKDNKAKDETSAKLEKMTALSLEELEKLRPATLMGITGTKLPSDSSNPRAIKTAYKMENGGSLILSVIDCGSEFGARFYESTYLNLLNRKEDELDRGVEYTKVIDFNGSKAIETCYKDINKCILLWFTGGRYLVTLQGENVKMEDIKQAAKEVSINESTEKVTTDTNDGQSIADELAKLTPATVEQMRALLPATLVGIARTGENAKGDDGIMFSNANYKKDDTTYITLSFYDCAGSEGADIYSRYLEDVSNPPEQMEKKYSKTIDFNGVKAVEGCDMLYNRCFIKYFGGKRYAVIIEEINLNGTETLKQAAGELKFK